ncbi:pentapeptide repeat protein [Stackebrandtia albiflava]|uniref:Pentapeptide repeat protein n=1 Tax=Stackebrandtia albiflava TaxID=406432 RepID=A0A562V2U2_9ACTN|nr:pentapeptide repeat-containing protein [Stackebrandtia albiflava]TWJ12204.1 pentapeptide repeat protein [Stackebrandtia albiflava]
MERVPGRSRRILWLPAAVLGLAFIAASGWGTWLLTGAATGDTANPGRVEAIRTALTAMVGAGGLVTLLVVMRRQWLQETTAADTRHDAEERRITDLYVAAAEQLGHEKVPVRLAALYSLDRLGRNHPRHRREVVDIWCAYLRQPFTPPARFRTTHATPDATLDRYLTGPEPDAGAEEYEVRATVQRLLARHLRDPRPAGDRLRRPPPERADGYWDLSGIDLTGATLVGADFTDCRFTDAEFGDARFHGDTRFVQAHFVGETGFRNVRCDSDTWFLAVRFEGPVTFEGARFDGDVLFTRSHFESDADFRDAGFEGDAWCDHVRFAPVSFTDTRFRGGTTFGSSRFTGRTAFTGARFEGDTGFEVAKFEGGPVVEPTGYLEPRLQSIPDPDFSRAEFHGAARFRRAEFAGYAHFNQARFHAETDFRDTTFTRIARFRQVGFEGTTHFDDARFAGVGDTEAYEDGPALQGDGSRFAHEVSFRRARLAGVDLDGVRFGGPANFTEARFGWTAGFRNAVFDAATTFRGAVFGRNVEFTAAHFAFPAAVTFEDASALPSVVEAGGWPAGWRTAPGPDGELRLVRKPPPDPATSAAH